MSNTVLAALPLTREFDNAGLPLGGGLLYTYQAGSSIPLPTYADLAGTVLNSNPVVLDSTGRQTVRYLAGTAYKLVLTDSTGATQLWSRDNYYPPISDQASLGLALYPQTTAELAASVTPVSYVYPPFNVRRYGADPTGTLPSDTALASAIAVCGITGGTILFPNGKYIFTNQVNLNSKIALIFQGDGAAEGGAQPGTQLVYTGTASPWFSFSAASGCWFRDMQLFSTNASFVGTYLQYGAISSAPSNFCGLRNVVMGAGNGTGHVHLNLDQTIVFTAEGCNFIGGNPSVMGAAAGSYANNIRFRDCHWATSYAIPIQIGGQAWLFSGCTHEPLANGVPGAIVSPASTQIVGFVMEACWFGDANSTAGNWIDLKGQNMSFIGNYLSGNQTGTTGIALEGFHGAVIQGNTFAALLNGINCVSSACDQTVLTGNVFNSVTNPVAGSSAHSTIGTWTVGSNFGLTLPAGQGAAGTNGYVAEGNGIIRQWGHATTLANGNNTITFPIAFPNNCFNVTASLNGVLATTALSFVGTLTASNFILNVQDSGATVDTAYWTAVGN